jgi:hypothetical protein
MYAKQQRVIESYVRVRAFLEAHPVTGPMSYAGPKEVLDEAVRRLREYAGDQVSGRQLNRAELRRQEQLIKRVMDRQMRPIVTIARAQIEPESDVRLPEALKMPRDGIGVTKFLQACDGMIAAAKPFEATFVANGLPVDFLAQFIAAKGELEAVLGTRGTLVGTHVGAKKGLEVQLRRGRKAVDRLDSVVRIAFEGDAVALEQWRVAKRAHAVRVGAPAVVEPAAA